MGSKKLTDEEDKPLGARARAARPPTLATARTEAVQRSGPKYDNKGANEVEDTHAFDLNYVDKRRNLAWVGHFQVRVPTLDDSISIGRMAASLRGNIPPMSLDPTTITITEMLSHIAIVVEQAPPWASGDALFKIRDMSVLGAIWEEVQDHLERFWGTKPAREDSSDAAEPPVDG